ncbi:thymidylate synthase [Methanoplanus sp. FWC-SCC4]|uniref:Putative thymidylate synthase n=1 Tax=Methanochimaera problematica TaxID=2609417 RepID=A0AA97I2Z8_9EURY|nr:thymidylate synthase [Methanoplanus sp. FWC-SCC4]WOF16830.1 thymidylate synthase [Methanoplanus sp. FWC-SCC4]
MFNIRAFSIGKAHEEVIKSILKHGVYILTEDGEKTLELPEPLNIHVNNPFADYMISPYNMFGEGAMKQYVHDLLNGTDSEFVYTYHDRLFDYPLSKGDGFVGDGDGKGIDQIAYIIEKLKTEPNSRRAEGITWFPPKDTNSNNPPCLQRIQCFVRDNKLNMHVEFRSNDMLSALGANMYALVHLQKMIADELSAEMGWYSHTSVSAHMYYERDHEELMKYVKGLGLMDSLRHFDSGELISK